MASFKEGDRVRTRSSCSPAVAGEEYVLVIDKNYASYPIIKVAGKGGYCSCEEQWELISSKPKQSMLKKLSILAKKNFDVKTQNYVRLAWLDESLEVTPEGQKAAATAQFLGITVEAYAEQVVKDLESEEKKNK